jgi:hypothetical protein
MRNAKRQALLGGREVGRDERSSKQYYDVLPSHVLRVSLDIPSRLGLSCSLHAYKDKKDTIEAKAETRDCGPDKFLGCGEDESSQ